MYEIDNHEDISVNREDKDKALASYKGAEMPDLRGLLRNLVLLSLTPNSN